MEYDLINPNLDYCYARDLSTENSEYERVIDAEGPYNDDGSMGPYDMFKLEFSGWKSWVEFKIKSPIAK